MTALPQRAAPPLPLGGGGTTGADVPIDGWAKLFIAVALAGAAAAVVVDLRVVLTLLNFSAFGVAVLGLWYPALGMLGIVLLCTLDPLVAPLLLTGGLWRWNTLNYWLLLVMLIWSPYLLRLSDLSTRCLQLLIVLLSLELLFGPDAAIGVQHVLRMVTMFGIVVYLARGGGSVETWFWSALASGVAAAAVTGVFLFTQSRLPYVNPNTWSFLPLGAVLLIALVYPMLGHRPGRQTLLGSLAVANGGLVFLSGSRGSLLVAAISLAYLVVAAPNIRRSLAYLSLGGLACVVMLSEFSQLGTASMDRFRLLLDSRQKARVRTSGRLDLAMGGYYIVRDHPLGVGTGGFARKWAELGAREGMSNFHRGKEFAAHSGWVKILAENGIPGVLLLLAYTLSFALVARRSPYPAIRRMGLLATTILALIWLSSEFDFKGLWLFCAGVTVLLHQATAAARRPARA